MTRPKNESPKAKAKRHAYHRAYYLRNREKIRAQARERHKRSDQYKPGPRPKKKDREFLYLRYYYDGLQQCHGLVVRPQPGDYIFKNTGKRVK